MLRRVPQAPSLLAVGIIVLLSVVASWRILAFLGLPLSSDDYDLAGWELRHVANKWLYGFGGLRRGDTGIEEENAAIDAYIRLQTDISDLESTLMREPASDQEDEALLSDLRDKRHERDRLENEVEAALERRVTAEISRLGLERSLPLFSGVAWVFPPVDVEFDNPPRVLVTSPRDRIDLKSARLLKLDLPLEAVIELEEKSEDGDTSALVVNSGAVATYPAVMPPMEDYAGTLELAAHEWLHQYLFFQPLGARYFNRPALRTINETVASIAGREIAALVLENQPLPRSAAGPETPSRDQGEEEETLYRQVMRQLRLDVDRLLGEGRIDEAEALMEEKRRYLAEHGYYIRKINQAYFAFYGLYGTSPASSSPIGPKVEELRSCSPSLGEFIEAVAHVTSEADLDRLLRECGAAPIPP